MQSEIPHVISENVYESGYGMSWACKRNSILGFPGVCVVFENAFD